MNKNVKLTETSLERTARMLANNYGIKVVFRAGECKTDGKTIFLPSVPAEAPSELLDAMQGYLDHETGHVLFSDFKLSKGLSKTRTNDKALMACANVIEDARIEKRMEDLFPGSAFNLRNAHSWVYETVKKGWSKLSPLDKVLSGLFLELKYPDSKFVEEFVDDVTRARIKDAAKRIKDVSTLQGTADSFAQAEKVYDALQDLIETQQPQPQGGDGGDEDDNDDSSGPHDSGKSSKNKSSQKKNENDKKASSKSKDNQKDEKASSKDGQKSAGQDDGGDGSEGSESDSSGEVDSNTQSVMDQLRQQTLGKPPGQGKDTKGAPMDALAQQLDQETGKLVPSGPTPGYQHNLQQDNSYVIYSTEKDSILKMPDQDKTTAGARLLKLREESRDLTNVIRQRLINSLRAMQQRRWVGGKEEGRLDTRALYKVMAGTSQAVYKQRTDKLMLDTAVAMMIDHSGSMNGRQLELAGEAAIVLGDVFNVLRIPFMVYGYSTDGGGYGYGGYGNVGSYARWNNLWIRIYGEFKDLWEPAALRLTATANNVRANTLDGEALRYGVQRLLARPEKRKIMIVFNDGEPCPGAGHMGRCQQYLKNIVHMSTKSGVEIIAFGVQTDNVKHYYPDYVVINDLKDMVKQPLVKIDEKLRKGMLAATK